MGCFPQLPGPGLKAGSHVSYKRRGNKVRPSPFTSLESQKIETELRIQKKNNQSINDRRRKEHVQKRICSNHKVDGKISISEVSALASWARGHGLEFVFAMHSARPHGRATPFCRHHTEDPEGLPAPRVPLEKHKKDNSQRLKPASGWQPSPAPWRADI